MQKLFIILNVVLFAHLIVVEAESDYISATLMTPAGVGDETDGGLSVTVDGYGAFGLDFFYNDQGSYVYHDALFNPAGPLGSDQTVNQSAVFLSTADYGSFLTQYTMGLQHTSGDLAGVPFLSTESIQALSSFVVDVDDDLVDDLVFGLTQTVEGSSTGATLTQTYEITALADKTFSLTRYLDADLYFSDFLWNDDWGNWGGQSDLILYEEQSGPILFAFDRGDDPDDPDTPYVSIGTSTSGDTENWQIDYWSDLAEKIILGEELDESIENPVPEFDANGIIDWYDGDIALAIQTDFTLVAGNTVSYTTITEWDSGAINELIPPQPIPEPSTLLLLGCGLVGLVGYGKLRFRRKKK